MKRRLQFSLGTLLIFVTLSAFGAHWYAAKRRADAAWHDFRSAVVEWPLGVAPADDLYDASVRVLRAEQAMPLSSRREGCKRHLERMQAIQGHYRNQTRLTESDFEGGADECDEYLKSCRQRIEQLQVWIEEAERWLNEAP